MVKEPMMKSGSFSSIYRPVFDQERDEWILQVPSNSVVTRQKILSKFVCRYILVEHLQLAGIYYENRVKSIVIGY